MKKLIVVISAAFMVQCSHHLNPSFSPLGGGGLPVFDKEGHRGCRGLMPENTIPAFLKAIDLGVTTLEMDAVITKDGQVVISHEPFFSHEITTSADGDTVQESEEQSLNIYQMNYEEVKTYDVGLKVNPRFPKQQKMHAVKPLLKDVIDSAEAYASMHNKKPVFYNIETKCSPDGDDIYHPKPDVFVELIMKVINEKNIQSRVIIQSFDARSLQYLHEHYPSIKTSLLVEGADHLPFAQQLKALQFIPTIYSPEHTLVTPLLIIQCHDMGIKIIPWTVNDRSEIDKLKTLGVDGIITDYPNLFNTDK